MTCDRCELRRGGSVGGGAGAGAGRAHGVEDYDPCGELCGVDDDEEQPPERDNEAGFDKYPRHAAEALPLRSGHHRAAHVPQFPHNEAWHANGETSA